jgi:hypothetical protein
MCHSGWTDIDLMPFVFSSSDTKSSHACSSHLLGCVFKSSSLRVAVRDRCGRCAVYVCVFSDRWVYLHTPAHKRKMLNIILSIPEYGCSSVGIFLK